jgi:hypothetical protein
MDIAPMKPARVVPGLLKVRRFQADQGPEFRTMSMSEVENDSATDGTPHGHGALQPQGRAESPNGRHI